MKIFAIFASALLIVLGQAGIARARDQVGEHDVLNVDPTKSYIFYRTHQRQIVRFMREVSPADRTNWEAARTQAYERAVARYQREKAAADRCHGAPDVCPPTRLPEPTPESFAYPPPETDHFVDVSPGRTFTRGDHDQTYLIAVPPGIYTLYGQIALDGNNATVGVCLCMGSARFEARAGQIVDLGQIRFLRFEGVEASARHGPHRENSMAIALPAEFPTRPDRLAGQPVVAAEWRAADKMPNYFGVEIDRLPAIPGVLAYRRDRVIDERTGADPAPTPGVH